MIKELVTPDRHSKNIQFSPFRNIRVAIVVLDVGQQDPGALAGGSKEDR